MQKLFGYLSDSGRASVSQSSKAFRSRGDGHALGAPCLFGHTNVLLEHSQRAVGMPSVGVVQTPGPGRLLVQTQQPLRAASLNGEDTDFSALLQNPRPNDLTGSFPFPFALSMRPIHRLVALDHAHERLATRLVDRKRYTNMLAGPIQSQQRGRTTKAQAVDRDAKYEIRHHTIQCL